MSLRAAISRLITAPFGLRLRRTPYSAAADARQRHDLSEPPALLPTFAELYRANRL